MELPTLILVWIACAAFAMWERAYTEKELTLGIAIVCVLFGPISAMSSLAILMQKKMPKIYLWRNQ